MTDKYDVLFSEVKLFKNSSLNEIEKHISNLNTLTLYFEKEWKVRQDSNKYLKIFEFYTLTRLLVTNILTYKSIVKNKFINTVTMYHHLLKHKNNNLNKIIEIPKDIDNETKKELEHNKKQLIESWNFILNNILYLDIDWNNVNEIQKIIN
jgi:hypothetical protein